ncbi:hypothetical protein BH09MYX1_BH09MYX1_12560 [soil metagenome]
MTGKFGWAFIVGISSTLLATSAFADDTIVKLKNGDMARGVLVELTRDDHVTIQLPSGESRTYPWSEVDTVSPVAPPPPPALPPPAPVQAVQPPPPQGAVVHMIANDEDARLSKLAGTGESSAQYGVSTINVTVDIYDALCRAPCDKVIRPGLYRIAGKGLIPTDDFDVPANGVITVDAHMRSKSRVTGGRVGLYVGIPFVVAGAVILWLASTITPIEPTVTSYGTIGDYYDPRPGIYALGGVMLGLGVIGVSLGIYFLATAHSSVDVTPGLTQGNSVESFFYRGMKLTF